MKELINNYTLLLTVVILETIALTCIKSYNINKNKAIFIIAILSYITICFLVKELLKQKIISVLVAMWSGLSIILSTLISIYYFKEKKNIMVFVGVFMVLIGIVIIDLYD